MAMHDSLLPPIYPPSLIRRNFAAVKREGCHALDRGSRGYGSRFPRR